MPDLGIYTGWVAHENSFAGGQVFFSERKDIALIFSGECFADRDTDSKSTNNRPNLGEKKTDCLVRLYEEEGDRFFTKLNGLFSGLLIDKKRNRAFLFNDRYGVGRIYYHETKEGIYFASEAKALLRILPELRAFDEEGVAQFLTYGCTLEDRTLFQGVRSLPGASVWRFEDGECHKSRYFSSASWEEQPCLPPADFEAEFQRIFKRLTPRYFNSESKIGISLTGGLDTRMIMACRPACAQEPVCFTFDGATGETLDTQLAARVAQACGLDHHILRLGPDFLSNFASHVDQTIYITDGCFGATGAHEVYLNKLARELAPVRLTGNYGSEILRGVSTFKSLGLSPHLINPDFRSFMTPSIDHLNRENPFTFAAFKEVPWNLYGALTAGRSQICLRTPYLDNELVALAYRAPDSLRGSSVPAKKLITNQDRALSRIPTDMGKLGEFGQLTRGVKHVTSKIAFKCDYLANQGFPGWLSVFDPLLKPLSLFLEITGRHRYLHYRHWFQNELAGHLNDVLGNGRVQSPFWNDGFLSSMAVDHIRGRKNYTREINAVVTLEAVERLLFRGLASGPYDPADAELRSRQMAPVLIE